MQGVKSIDLSCIRRFSTPFHCHSEDYDAESLWNNKRQRLFDHLDSLNDKPITWIAAPAGSGKTTLVSSWLSERKLHSLWYQIDEGDAHLADFFYYMGLALKKHRLGAK